jgi:CheY-like chemotaxis protein
MADKVTVIVADDDELDMTLTKGAIHAEFPDAEVLSFEDGEAALSELRKISAGDRIEPDLVLLDYKMPKLGCLEVVQEIGPEFWDRVPLVLFSSSVGPTDVQRCIGLGVREYVEKPTDPDVYRATVKELCGRYARLL